MTPTVICPFYLFSTWLSVSTFLHEVCKLILLTDWYEQVYKCHTYVLAAVVKFEVCLQYWVTTAGFDFRGDNVVAWDSSQLELVWNERQLCIQSLACNPQSLNFTLQQLDTLRLDADNSILVLQNLCEVIRYSRAAGQGQPYYSVMVLYERRPTIKRRLGHL